MSKPKEWLSRVETADRGLYGPGREDQKVRDAYDQQQAAKPQDPPQGDAGKGK